MGMGRRSEGRGKEGRGVVRRGVVRRGGVWVEGVKGVGRRGEGGKTFIPHVHAHMQTSPTTIIKTLTLILILIYQV